MVNNITSLTGNGLKDWIIQRISSLYFAGFVLFLLIYVISHPDLSYAQWSLLFQNKWFKIAAILAMVAVTLHTWIGIWTVITDYIKCSILRLTVEMLVLGGLLAQFIWFLMIVWGS